eukprot:CAMPEP_0197442544 /NCGR_PEP_ID=MMETSP1175-20131217/8535_1 /TAXON_ID=1003142 /ORGANISM="Triceratium dubium, Strain CCMP147" /LENGTH=224 /DNA_ID=CAMNT_0042973043 /DNA_START=64 /DNA_END=738 /DNA_ORIENTATION=+
MSFCTPVTTSHTIPKRRIQHKNKRHTSTIAEKTKWRSLMAHLNSLEREDRAAELSSLRGPMGWNVLHMLCWNAAPLDIIGRVANICPDLVSEVDLLGRTPLHIALCFFAPDLEVVSFLLTVDRAALSIQDKHGKTPLAYACENAGKADVTTDMRRSLIKALVKANPYTIFVEDNEGISPIERALCSNAPMGIVETLQRYSMYMRRQECAERYRKAVKTNRTHTQ